MASQTTTRRRALARAAAFAAAAPAILPSRGAAQAGGRPLALVSPGGFQVNFAEMMWMVAGGHLAREGFAPTLLGANGQAAANAQLVAGHASFTRSSMIDLVMAARDRPRPPMVGIATLYQSSTFFVLSLPGAAVRGPSDFRGRKVGVVSVGGTTELLLDLMLARAGIPAAEVPRFVTGNNAGALQLVRQGRVDCFIASVNVVVALRRAGEDFVAMSTDEIAPMPSQVYVATPELVEREPDLVLRFLRALDASARDFLGGRDVGAMVDAMAARFEMPGLRDREALLATNRAAVELWLGQGRDNLLRNVPALWRAGAEAIERAGLARIARVEDFYRDDLLDRARG